MILDYKQNYVFKLVLDFKYKFLYEVGKRFNKLHFKKSKNFKNFNNSLRSKNQKKNPPKKPHNPSKQSPSNTNIFLTTCLSCHLSYLVSNLASFKLARFLDFAIFS